MYADVLNAHKQHAVGADHGVVGDDAVQMRQRTGYLWLAGGAFHPDMVVEALFWCEPGDAGEVFGGILLVLGHAGMAFEGNAAVSVGGVGTRDEGALRYTYLSLALIIMGVGFLKPNISTIVGKLYAENDPRRDSGFSLFYAGINLGALFSSLVCGYRGETYGWKFGFGAAGIGMLAGLCMFLWGQKYLHGHAEPKDADALRARIGPLPREWWIYLGAFAGVATADTRFGGPGERVFLEVASERVACPHAMIPDFQCLHVREVTYDDKGLKVGTPGEFEHFYDSIEGYTHEPGIRNVLRVDRYTVKNPPADASSSAYVLDMVVESANEKQ